MLSKPQILDRLENTITIKPFYINQLQTNSYDVTLGDWIVRQRKPKFWDRKRTIRYNSREGIARMWKDPERCEQFVKIKAGETILAHTFEKIGGNFNVTSEMQAKSTTGRHAMSVCKCAGLGDVGYESHWTMEITNHSYWHIEIDIGEAIAQILFHEVEGVHQEYSGRYGQGLWTPKDMIPKGQYE